MTVAIIETGKRGSGIAKLLASKGVEVAIGHRDPAKATKVAEEIGGEAQGGWVAAAVKTAHTKRRENHQEKAMTRNHRNAVAAMLATTLLASPGAGSASAQAAGAKTMWFADSYATAFYTLDRSRHEVVMSIEAGPKGGNPTVVRRKLEDGGVERISIDGGNEREKMRVTLVVTRHGDALCANVLTETGQSLRQPASY